MSMEKHPEKTVTVIGFGLRLAATLLDTLFVSCLAIAVGMAAALIGFVLDTITPNQTWASGGLIILCGLIFSVAYFVVSWARTGQTIGHRVVGIKVVGADGNPPSRGKALLRFVGYLVNGLLLSIGFLWVVFDRKRQGWHDKMAGTYVVHDETEFSAVDAVELVASDPKGAWIWVVFWLFLAIGMPLALISTLWALGLYVGQFFAKILGI